MSISVTCGQLLSVVETVSMGLVDAANPTITHAITDTYTVLNASSTPPGTTVASGTVTLSGGTVTLDLTSILGPTVNGTACPVNFTGKKINAIKIQSAAANTNPITIVGGASNGYLLFGASGSLILPAGGDQVSMLLNASLPAVDSTHKTITVTSAMSAAVFNIELVGG